MRADNETLRHKQLSCVALVAMTIHVLTPITAAQAQTASPNSRTPIKHLIVVVGENHSFDNVFATYVPPKPNQSVWNLLSQGIVDKNGVPTNNNPAAQQQATSQKKDPITGIISNTYQLAPTITGTFTNLPQPNTGLNGYPYSQCGVSQALDFLGQNFSGPMFFCSDPGTTPPTDYPDLKTGGTGQQFYYVNQQYDIMIFPVPDCRYPSPTSSNPLPNAPYSIVGAALQKNNCGPPLSVNPFKNYYGKDAITPTAFTDTVGDPVHRFFQMWQQNDCSYDPKSPPPKNNPSGCLHDLYAWVATSVGWQVTQDSKPPTNDQGTFQGGIPMGFYNMGTGGDFPTFKLLAQQYAISDNYHQPIMGGTGPNSQFMMTGDVFYYTLGPTPPSRLIEDPTPQTGSNNFYTQGTLGPDPGNTSVGGLVNCSDPNQPGVKPILDYLSSLPYRPKSNCESGHYYQVDNEYPHYDHTGTVIPSCTPPLPSPPPPGCIEFPAGSAFSIGPQTIKTIGESLHDAGISWKHYGEGFKQAANPPLAQQLYCAICNGFQYSSAIMLSGLKDNLVDLDQFFTDVKNGGLPQVSFIKPDTLLDGHPGYSTPPVFEAFVSNIIQAVQANPSLWQSTAILITFDESGGYYDSGYIQPLDFFGDGARTVLIAVSPFARTGFVDHNYTDHGSVLKFIERNWGLAPLSARSRDNLPNPASVPSTPYFPANSPAIGDLMEMFRFTAASHDFNSDEYSDIVLRDGSGNVAMWIMNGAAAIASGGLGNVPAAWSLVGQRDFDGDGKADLLWRDTSGNTAIWFMNGTQVASTGSVGNVTGWSVVGTGDFNGDGLGDILWRAGWNGETAIWLMNGANVLSTGGLGAVPANFSVAGTGDFDGDGKTDILWRDNLGNTSIWFMNGTAVASAAAVGNIPTSWTVVGTGDFNGDGMTDIVWRDNLGNTSIWLMNGAAVLSAGSLGNIPTTLSIAQTGDYNSDGKTDILWRDTSGNTSIWFMNGTAVASTGVVGNIPTTWTVQSVNAE
jgi:phospholipase C